MTNVQAFRERYRTLSEPEQAQARATVIHLIAIRRIEAIKLELAAVEDAIVAVADRHDALVESLLRAEELAVVSLRKALDHRADAALAEQERNDCFSPAYSASPF